MTVAILRACSAAATHLKLAAAAIGLIAVTTGATVAIVVVGSREVTPPVPTYRAAPQPPAAIVPSTPRVVVPPKNVEHPVTQPTTGPGAPAEVPGPVGGGSSPVQIPVDTIVPNNGGNGGSGGTGSGVIPVGNPGNPSLPGPPPDGNPATPSRPLPAPPPPIIDQPTEPTDGAPSNPPVVVPNPKPPVPAVTSYCLHSNDRYDVYRLIVGDKISYYTVQHASGKIGKGCPPLKDTKTAPAKDKTDKPCKDNHKKSEASKSTSSKSSSSKASKPCKDKSHKSQASKHQPCKHKNSGKRT